MEASDGQRIVFEDAVIGDVHEARSDFPGLSDRFAGSYVKRRMCGKVVALVWAAIGWVSAEAIVKSGTVIHIG